MQHKYAEILKAKYGSWKELEDAISTLPTTVERGDAFEDFTYAYFTLKKQLYQIDAIYTSKEIPQKYREQYKIGNLQHHDSGVDGFIILEGGKSFAYQCKFRVGRVKPTYEELTKFWSDARYCDYCCTVANSYSVSSLSDKHEQNLSILVNDLDALDADFFEAFYSLVNAKPENEIKAKKTPFKYQEKIINDVLEGFAVEDRGKIIAACGTGKTLTSLWIVEKMECSSVLFLAPSIALVKQTLEAWAADASIPFSYLCVCSDNTVNEDINSDETDLSISALGIPVTTDEEEIAKFLNKHSVKRKYVFSTYQSADKISNAQHKAKTTFDLIICDEAHRTAGLRSAFSLALEDQFIQAKKRIFMTATERMVKPMLLRRAADNGQVIFTMDDENTYGPLLSRYNFGDAIKDKTISDYKILIAGVKESEVYDYIATNATLSLKDIDEKERISTAESLYSKILLAKTIREYPIKKIISFHSTIQRASDFVTEEGSDISLRSVIKEFNKHILDDGLYVNTVNSKQDSGTRSRTLETFKEKDYSVVSNAKCLTEGVDVPIIDSVYFVDPKKSLVDIVQACGRALRTKKGVEKTAYFVVPILIPETDVASDILYSEQFEAVYNIIQALRDQDNRLADWIDYLNRKYVRGEKGGHAGVGGADNDDSGEGSPIDINIEGIDIQQFSEELCVKIATVNANPTYLNGRKRSYGRGERKAGQTRLFKTIGDFTYKSYMENLVDPTIAIFKSKRKHVLISDDIVINHNNVSHTVKLGLIRKDPQRKYALTELGERYIDGKIADKQLFTRQLLRYSCSVEDSKIDRILFPYRACLRILSLLGSNKSLSFIEFAFCIYPMYDSSMASITQAVADIKFLRADYPNLQFANINNRGKILSELNEYFGTQLSETDIWGTQPTTVKNQYMYFRNHLSMFTDIIEINDGVIHMKNAIRDKVDAYLGLDSDFETYDRQTLMAKYTEPFIVATVFSLTDNS